VQAAREFLLSMQQFLAGLPRAAAQGKPPDASLEAAVSLVPVKTATLQDQPQGGLQSDRLDEAALIASLLQELLQDVLALQPGQPSGGSAHGATDTPPTSTAAIPQGGAAGEEQSTAVSFDGAELKLPQSLMQLLMKLPTLAGRLAEKLSQLSGGGIRVALQGDSLTLLPARQLSTPWSVAANAAPGLPAVQAEAAVLPGIAPVSSASPSAGWLFGQQSAQPEATPVSLAQPAKAGPAPLVIDLPEEGLKLSLRPAVQPENAAGTVSASVLQPAAAAANFELRLSSSGEDAAELRARLSITRLDSAPPGAAMPTAEQGKLGLANLSVPPATTQHFAFAPQPTRNPGTPQAAQVLLDASPAGPLAQSVLRQTAVLDPTTSQPLLSSFVSLPAEVIGQQPVASAKGPAVLSGLDGPADKASAAELLQQSKVVAVKAELDAPLNVQKSVSPAIAGADEVPTAVRVEGQPAPQVTPGPEPQPEADPQVIQVSPQLLQFSSPAAGQAGYAEALRAMFPRIAEVAQHYQQYGNGLYHAQLELDPPALGKVLVNIAVRGETVSLQLAVLSPASKEQLAAGSAQLRQSLQDAGLNVAEMRIVTLDPEERDASGEKQTGGNQPDRQHEQGQTAEDARALAAAIKSAPRWEAALKTAGAA